ncbi:response regulator transcription factor [Methylovirgula sp. HY1]|uniref:response regulator transcription factor n=1 Tax=Methylovirgula sp. HY1 TaxID=2822761 RepID=UPI001C5BE0D6|nr:response regulator transcription factor [Methylovirgula sp. HY1]QXX75464.1 Transcriptional regulatory protein DegU [Methylovirgula sp. HY1]
MSRFLIVDDHPLFREALRSAVNVGYPAAEICEATLIADAVAMIADPLHRFDLVLLDLTLPGTSGFEGLLELRGRFPYLPIMIVSSLEDRDIVQQALFFGAAGFVPKSAKKAEIAAALATVMSGAIYLPCSLADAKRAHPPKVDMVARLATLTPQQLRVLQMLRQGLLNKQIAFELAVGETTVKAHVTEVLRKLGVSNRTQAVIETGKLDFDKLALQPN